MTSRRISAGSSVLHKLEALGAVAGDEDLVAFLLQGVGQDPLDVRVVIDDEDLGRHALP